MKRRIYAKKSLGQHYLRDKNIKNRANTSVLPILSKNDFEDIILAIPKLPEQKQIASILSNVDAQMQQTQKLVDLTQRLKKEFKKKISK